MVSVDPREDIYNAIVGAMGAMYLPYKWTRILNLVGMLGNEQLTQELWGRIVEVEEMVGLDIYTLETLLQHSDSLDNFVKVGNRRVTELEIEKAFNEITTWLGMMLSHVSKDIKFSRSRG